MDQVIQKLNDLEARFTSQGNKITQLESASQAWTKRVDDDTIKFQDAVQVAIAELKSAGVPEFVVALAALLLSASPLHDANRPAPKTSTKVWIENIARRDISGLTRDSHYF